MQCGEILETESEIKACFKCEIMNVNKEIQIEFIGIKCIFVDYTLENILWYI